MITCGGRILHIYLTTRSHCILTELKLNSFPRPPGHHAQAASTLKSEQTTCDEDEGTRRGPNEVLGIAAPTGHESRAHSWRGAFLCQRRRPVSGGSARIYRSWQGLSRLGC